MTVIHTKPLTAFCPGLPGWAGTRKVKPVWILLILLEQETVSGMHWHQLGHMQVCTSLQSQTDNHASTPPLSVLQAGCSSGRPTNSVKALTVIQWYIIIVIVIMQRLTRHVSVSEDSESPALRVDARCNPHARRLVSSLTILSIKYLARVFPRHAWPLIKSPSECHSVSTDRAMPQ